MSFSSFKENKLLFENFRKFVNEQDEVDLLAGEEEEGFEMSPETEQPTYGSQEEYTAAADAAESSLAASGQEAETARLARKAAADKRSQETDVLIPDDEAPVDVEVAGPDTLTRVTNAYLDARSGAAGGGRAGDEGSGIQQAIINLETSGDKDALRLLMSNVQQGVDGKYSFIKKEKPTELN